MDATQKRLLKELRDSQREPNEQIEELSPIDDDDLFRWRATIRGQDDTPYAGEAGLRVL
jgi:ubiquitin-protein ligase